MQELLVCVLLCVQMMPGVYIEVASGDAYDWSTLYSERWEGWKQTNFLHQANFVFWPSLCVFVYVGLWIHNCRTLAQQKQMYDDNPFLLERALFTFFFLSFLCYTVSGCMSSLKVAQLHWTLTYCFYHCLHILVLVALNSPHQCFFFQSEVSMSLPCTCIVHGVQGNITQFFSFELEDSVTGIIQFSLQKPRK